MPETMKELNVYPTVFLLVNLGEKKRERKNGPIL